MNTDRKINLQEEEKMRTYKTVGLVIGRNADSVNSQIQDVLNNEEGAVTVLLTKPYEFVSCDTITQICVTTLTQGQSIIKDDEGHGLLRFDPDLLVFNDLPALIRAGLSEEDKQTLIHGIAQTGQNLIVGIPFDGSDADSYYEAGRIINKLLNSL